MMTSLNSILKKEEGLIKEKELNFETYVSMMHKVDDYERWFNKSGNNDDEIAKMKIEIVNRKQREKDIELELAETRRQLRRYIVKLFDV